MRRQTSGQIINTCRLLYDQRHNQGIILEIAIADEYLDALQGWKPKRVVRPTSGATVTSHTGCLNLLETLETRRFDQSYLSDLPSHALCHVRNTVHYRCLAAYQICTDAKVMMITNTHRNPTACGVYYQARASIMFDTLGHNTSARSQ
jgi:hypothetical protein